VQGFKVCVLGKIFKVFLIESYMRYGKRVVSPAQAMPVAKKPINLPLILIGSIIGILVIAGVLMFFMGMFSSSIGPSSGDELEGNLDDVDVSDEDDDSESDLLPPEERTPEYIREVCYGKVINERKELFEVSYEDYFSMTDDEKALLFVDEDVWDGMFIACQMGGGIPEEDLQIIFEYVFKCSEGATECENQIEGLRNGIWEQEKERILARVKEELEI